MRLVNLFALRINLFVSIILLLFVATTSGFAQNPDPPPCDPLNPPASIIVQNQPGTWGLDAGPSGGQSGDLRGYEYPNDDPRGGPVWVEWLKSQGFFFWDKVYYLRGRIGGSYNDLNAGNLRWSNETDREPYVLGPFKVSVSKYGYPHQSFSYPQTVGHPPQPQTLGILSTDQGWSITVRARIPSLAWDPYNNTYVLTGVYYDWDKQVYVTTPVSKWYYRYQP